MRHMWVIKMGGEGYYTWSGGLTDVPELAALYWIKPTRDDDEAWWIQHKCKAVKVKVTVREES